MPWKRQGKHYLFHWFLPPFFGCILWLVRSLFPDQESTLNSHWKDWCLSWSSNTLATWCKELTHWKNPDARVYWGQEEKGATEDEMVGWHHWCNGQELGQTLGDGEEQCSIFHRITKSQRQLDGWKTVYLQYHVNFFFRLFSLIRLACNTEHNSLWHIVGPCWWYILYILVCVC